MTDEELLSSLLDDLVGDAMNKVEMEHKAKAKAKSKSKSKLSCKVERKFYAECAEQSARDMARTRAMIVDLFNRRTSHE